MKEKNKHPLRRNAKIVGFVKFAISVAVIIALGHVVFNYVPFISRYDHYVIATDSMEPVIDVGDIVIIDAGVAPEDLEPGQIVAFYADITGDGHRYVVVHYLDSVTMTEEGRIYRTRPEVSDDLDPWILTDSDIIGSHVGTVPNIGPILLFAQSAIGRIVIILDVVVIYMLFSFLATPKQSGKTTDAEPKEESAEHPQA